MKLFFTALLSLILFSINAQQTKITTFNGTLDLTLDQSIVMIKFLPGTGSESRDAALDPAYFLPFDHELNKPQFNYAFVSLKPGITVDEIFNATNNVSANPDVEYASVMYRMAGGEYCSATDKIFVKYNSPETAVTGLAFAKENYGSILTTVEQVPIAPNLFEFNFNLKNTNQIFSIADEIFANGGAIYSEPNLVVITKKMTDDTYYDYQWSLNNTGSEIQYNGIPGSDVGTVCAWDFARGAGIKVGILDEGVDLTHDDLTDNLLPGYDACFWGGGAVGNSNGGFEPGSDDAHGTNCAGIVCAIADNGIGVSGVAPESNVVPVRIAYSNDFGWVLEYAWVEDAIYWAVDDAGVDIMSNSYILGAAPAIVSDAIDYAITEGRGGLGAIFVAAAGNFNDDILEYPGKYDNAIGVAASSMCDERKSPSSCDGENFWGSNYGNKLDVSAPGVKIPSTDISGGAGYDGGDYYLLMNGTSAASPCTAGVLALMLSLNPGLTYEDARYYLESTCAKVGGYVYDIDPDHPNGTWTYELGYGRVDACSALEAIAENLTKADIVASIDAVSDDVVNPGDAIDVDYALTNNGYTDAGSFNNAILLSEDCAIGDDLDLTSFATGSLAIDETVTNSNSVTIPENTTEGDYQLILYADNGLAVDEGIEINNISCFDITVECAYSPGDGEVFYSYAGITDSLEIITTSGCDWNITPAPPAWIDIVNGSATGSGYFVYTLEENDEIFDRDFTFHYGPYDYTINQTWKTGIENISGDFTIYPNPATDHIIVEGNNQNGEFEILNVTGEKIMNGNINPQSTTISLNDFPSGLYFIQIIIGDGAGTKSFVVK